MQVSEGKIGRVFVMRLEEGDVIPTVIEEFADANDVKVGHALVVGGVGQGSVVVGPRESDAMPPEPMLLPVSDSHEVLGVGVLAPNEQGRGVLHMHAALGRAGGTHTGCLRPGVNTWLVAEVVLYEIIGTSVARKFDEASQFLLLQAGQGGA